MAYVLLTALATICHVHRPDNVESVNEKKGDSSANLKNRSLFHFSIRHNPAVLCFVTRCLTRKISAGFQSTSEKPDKPDNSPGTEDEPVD